MDLVQRQAVDTGFERLLRKDRRTADGCRRGRGRATRGGGIGANRRRHRSGGVEFGRPGDEMGPGGRRHQRAARNGRSGDARRRGSHARSGGGRVRDLRRRPRRCDLDIEGRLELDPAGAELARWTRRSADPGRDDLRTSSWSPSDPPLRRAGVWTPRCGCDLEGGGRRSTTLRWAARATSRSTRSSPEDRVWSRWDRTHREVISTPRSGRRPTEGAGIVSVDGRGARW